MLEITGVSKTIRNYTINITVKGELFKRYVIGCSDMELAIKRAKQRMLDEQGMAEGEYGLAAFSGEFI